MGVYYDIRATNRGGVGSMKKVELNVKTGDYYTPVNVKTLAKNVTCTNHFTGETTNVRRMLDGIKASRNIVWDATIPFPNNAYFEANDMGYVDQGYVVGEAKVVNGVRGYGIYKLQDNSFVPISSTIGENVYKFGCGRYGAHAPDAEYVATTTEGNGVWQCFGGEWSKSTFAPTDGTQYYKPSIATDNDRIYVIAPYEMRPVGQDWNTACDCVFVSTDRLTWTRVELPSPQYMSAICESNGKFVIACAWSDVWFESVDGITWTEIHVPVYKEWTDIKRFNNTWVAIAQDDWSNECVIYSEDDCATWNVGSMPSAGYWRRMASGGNRLVAIKELYNWNYTNTLAVSYDGKSWTPILAPNFGSWKAIANTGSRWLLAKGGQTLNALAERYDCQNPNDYYSTVYTGI